MSGTSVFYLLYHSSTTTEIYTLSLHDALPIYIVVIGAGAAGIAAARRITAANRKVIVIEAAGQSGGRCLTDNATFDTPLDRKSTRLNSSHPSISYAVFCLKKKIKQK